MAAFCTNCGVALASSTGFCPSCGTPVAAAPVAAPVQAAPPPAAAYPTMPPPKSSSSALKIILIVIAVVVGLGVLGFGALLFIGWRVSKSATVNGNANGNGVSVSVPGGGSITAGTPSTLTEQDLGVPLYPGASLDTAGSATIVRGTTKVVQATYWTTDPVSSVTSFYQGKLGSGLNVMGLGSETIMNYGSGNNTVAIMVDADSGKTKINVIHSFTPGQ